MDQQNQNASAASTAAGDINRNVEANRTVETNACMGGTSDSYSGEASFDELMQQSPTLCPLSGWLKCLRKPALSMQYSIQKRHVPDMDKPVPSRDHKAREQGQSAAQSAAQSAQKGQNSDVMDVTGGFTIRYFDLIAGAMGLLLMGCIWKGCCRLKRVMK